MSPNFTKNIHDDDQLSTVAPSELSSDQESEAEVNRQLATENRRVKVSKTVMFVILFAAAFGCSYATYAISRRAEDREFRTKVESYAKEIGSFSKITASTSIKAYTSHSVTTTSYASAMGELWPFVTVQDFESRAAQTMGLSGSTYVISYRIIEHDQVIAWEEYAIENKDRVNNGNNVTPFIWEGDQGTPRVPANSSNHPYFAAFWQSYPAWLTTLVNLNGRNTEYFRLLSDEVLEKKTTTISPFYGFNLRDGGVSVRSHVMTPVFESLKNKIKVVGLLQASLVWKNLFENVLPEDATESLTVVAKDDCGNSATLEVEGAEVVEENLGDTHDPRTDFLIQRVSFDILDETVDLCQHYLEIYPAAKYFDTYYTNIPIVYAAVIFSVFMTTILVFLLYDCFVQQRQIKVLHSAQRTSAIVSSLFPEQVRERLLEEATSKRKDTKSPGGSAWWNRSTSRKANECGNDDRSTATMQINPKLKDANKTLLVTKPIADLFLDCTVLFADIGNFTSWASERQPDQVFCLLEQVYGTFDAIAKTKKIFKVETIGDCYVAAAGVPDPRADHAVVMACFANKCRRKMAGLVRQLEVILGPDTGDLAMRYGLHSGPVTAGVLRGEKSRFQLFGDTVNTAARMESTGEVNRVHMSQATADALAKVGKNKWAEKRKDLVNAKGKGFMQTYWLCTQTTREIADVTPDGFETLQQEKKETEEGPMDMAIVPAPVDDESGSDTDCSRVMSLNIPSQRKSRLIDWNVDVLSQQLRKIVAMRAIATSGSARKTTGGLFRRQKGSQELPAESAAPPSELVFTPETGMTVLDEVQEIISLSNETKTYQVDPELVCLSSTVVDQLKMYVTNIAALYKDNSFHSYEHATHVTQSVTKLLTRVVTANDGVDFNSMQYTKRMQDQTDNRMHQFTYGITSDPIIQFSCTFSSMIHDVEHTGVGNATLVAEEDPLAIKYKNKSVAEQNSVDVAWNMLMQPEYAELRACIYTDRAELNRFRQLVVNSVMATDIVDKELGAARKARWAKAFNTSKEEEQTEKSPSEYDIVNRKATIVIEHIIQASDVSHTMQHWHVYIKWNEKLFHELYKAHLEGRGSFDPSKGWYKGELGFFDFYIIPLAKKLKDCGVFGVSSDEYLNYALQNRAEWEQKGESVVAKYMSKYN